MAEEQVPQGAADALRGPGEVAPGAPAPDDTAGAGGQTVPLAEEDSPREKERNRRLENRLKRLTDRLRTKDVELAELRGQVMSMQATIAPLAAPPRPTREQYPDEDRYLDAVLDWREARQKGQTAAPAQATPDAAHEAYIERLAAAQDTLPDDYDEVVKNSEVWVSAAVRQALLDHDQGPQLVYYLAQNPDAAQRLNQARSPLEIGRALGRLESQMDTPDTASRASPPRTTPSPTSGPAAPIRPLPGAPSGAPAPLGDPGQLPLTRFREWYERSAGR